MPIDPRTMRAIRQIESGGNPNATTGSYKGLYQLSDGEFRRYGGQGSIYDPAENERVAGMKLGDEAASVANRLGRDLTPAEQYLVHQQGVGGAYEHLTNPDRPAWQSMLSTGEGRQKGEGWARKAIWGNVPDQYKAQFGSVDNITSGQFADMWQQRFGRAAGEPTGPMAAAFANSDSPLSRSPGISAINAATNPNPSGAAMAFDTTPPPDDGFLGQLARFGGNASNGNYTVADALGNAGVAMMSLDNAKGAGALATNLALTKKQQAKGPSEFQYDPKSGTFFRTRSDGTLETTRNPNVPDEPAPRAKISESSLKNVAKTMDDYDFIHQTSGTAAEILDDLEKGKLDLGAMKNLVNSGQNVMGMSDEKSRAYAKYTRFVQDLVNSNLRLNNGVQTEGDAFRELKSIAANGTSYDNETAKDALRKVLEKSSGALSRGAAHLETRKATFGAEPFESYDPMVQGWKVRQSDIDTRLKAAKEAQSQPAAPAPSGKFEVMGVRRPK